MAVSPQTVDRNAAIREARKLAFPVLQDVNLEWARKLSLVFELPEALQTIYEGFGIDLPGTHGGGGWELPLPARIVTDGEGVVRSLDADPDYTIRPEPEATLEVLRAP